MKKGLASSLSFLKIIKTTDETVKAIYKLFFFVLIVFGALPANAQVSKSIIAKQLVLAKPATERPAVTDLADMKISSETYSTKSGVSNVYFQQHVNDIPVYNAILNVHVTKDNQLLTFGNRFVPDAKAKAGIAFPSLTAEQAVEAAARQLGYTVSERLVIKQTLGGAIQKVVFAKGKLSREDIPVQLMWQPLEDSMSATPTVRLRLAWDLSIAEPGGKNWWSIRVDAATGEILNKNNWVVQCSFGELGDECPHQPGTAHSPADLSRLTNKNNFLPVGGGTYNVFAIPMESPYYGSRQLLVSPADAIASPFGWHDTNGVAGAEFTITRGNNVHAYTDIDANDIADAGSSPDGGAGLLFDFPIDFSLDPSTYGPAAVTNLFYMNNFMHDFAYKYGFDELSANFQVNNYGHGGAGGDDVQAEAQGRKRSK
jgi:extracellular elastinolytic metalloproteinase